MEQKRFRITITGKNHNQSIEIDKDSCVLGRGKECDLIVEHDLISRKHLKIAIVKEELVIEELGSTNGTLLNNVKLEKNIQTNYLEDSKVMLGGATGLALKIEMLAVQNNVINIQSADTEKTLIHSLPALKVANGRAETPALPGTHTSTNIKLVPDISAKKSADKKNLDGHLKQLVLQESEKLREKSLREAQLIKEKALEEEKNIQLKAHKEAREIIESSKEEAIRKKAEAEQSIISLREQIKISEHESEMIIKNHKLIIGQLEEKIASLRQIESGHNQKMKQLDDEYQSTKERIRNENLLLEELKHQSNTVRKGADLKLEEVLLQERRSRTKIEAEIAEAHAQTAKIYAEAEKTQALKDNLIPEINQLKSDKSKIEKDINDSQIKYSKLEHEYEKYHNSFQNIIAQTDQAKNAYQEVLAQINEQQSNLATIQFQLDERERASEIKITHAESQAESIIENAHNEAKRITLDSQIKFQKFQEQHAKAIKDLEAQRIKFNEDLEIEKKIKLKDVQHEIEMLRSSHSQELEKLEIKKTSIVNESKWIESNAVANSEKLLSLAKAEAQEIKDQTLKNLEILKVTTKNEVQILKERTQKEIQSAKENANTEIQSLKKEANLEISTAKNNLVAEVARIKAKTEEDITKARNELAQEFNKVKDEAHAVEEMKKTLQFAIEKADSLMNDNHLEAKQKIQDMIADAEKQVVEIENAGKVQRQKEQVLLDDLRAAEAEKIEDMKVKFEEYKIASKNEMAEAIGSAAQEYLAIEMIKSRNLILDEKLIKKISEKSKKIVTDVALGRLQSSAKGINDLFKVTRVDYVGIIKIICALVFVGGTLYFAKTHPDETREFIEHVTEFIKKQDLTLPF